MDRLAILLICTNCKNDYYFHNTVLNCPLRPKYPKGSFYPRLFLKACALGRALSIFPNWTNEKMFYFENKFQWSLKDRSSVNILITSIEVFIKYIWFVIVIMMNTANSDAFRGDNRFIVKQIMT